MSPTRLFRDRAARSRRSAKEATRFTSRPSQDEVVVAIYEEAAVKGVACNYITARRVYGMLGNAVGGIRKRGGNESVYHLTQRDLDDLHSVFDAIMPDDVVNPAEGSAHDLVHKHFLKGDEFAIVHTRTGQRLEDCAIMIEIDHI